MKSPLLIPALFLVVTLHGCATSSSYRSFHSAGTMFEVLRDGKTQGRARLDCIIESSGTYAVGALAGLGGEILILNDEPWISTVQPNGVQRTRIVDPSAYSATLYAAAHVAAWQDRPVKSDVPMGGLEELVVRSAQETGTELDTPLPFLIEGEFADIELHVVNKMCPMQAKNTGASAKPFRGSRSRARGVMFGVFANDSEGKLTHHGSRIHAHILIPGEVPLMGHVDSIRVTKGATIRLPKEYLELN